MFIHGFDAEKDALLHVAQLMCLAARTAPKGGGVDCIVTAVVGKAVKDQIVAGK
jgi:uncharacterized ferredoxin-like protein